MVQASDDVREGLTVDAANTYFGDPATHAVISSNDSNGKFITAQLEKEIDKAGGKRAPGTVLYEPGTSDYSPYLTRIKAANPDVLHIWWLPTDGLNIVEQAKRLNVAKTYNVWGVEPADLTTRLGQDLSGVVTACSPICRTITTSERTAAFWEQYEKFLGGDHDFGAASGGAAWYHDGALMLFEALTEAGGVTDTNKIADALEAAEYQGVLGPVNFDERHIVRHGNDFCHFTGAGQPKCEYRSPKGA
jgi:ABC-type branched-subunit amino acid transport system substrate-binding protein